MYVAWLCYSEIYDGDDLEDAEPVIRFEQPEEWQYKKIIPIQFSVLHSWSNRDVEIY